MNTELFENTKIAAYFLWEYTQHDNALELWYCAEDLGCFMERNAYLHPDIIQDIKMRGVYNYSYVLFVRNIAYRIFLYTGQINSVNNWYLAEELLKNDEWCSALTRIAQIYRREKDNSNLVDDIRSDQVKNYYRAYL